jgi:hypothetical protein
MKKILKKTLSFLCCVFVVLTTVPCQVSARVVKNDLNVKNRNVIRVLNAYTKQKAFKIKLTDFCLSDGVFSPSIDFSKSVFIADPTNLSRVSVLIAYRNKVGRIVGDVVIGLLLDSNPENLKDIVGFFTADDSLKFGVTATYHNFRSFISVPFFHEKTLDFDEVQVDEPDPILCMCYGKKRSIDLQRV